MLYDASGNEQQGRFFEIGEKTKGIASEHRKGPSIKKRKNTSWKYRSTCQQCRTEFPGRSDGGNRFCKPECHQEWSVNRWFDCSCCMAKIGIGAQTASKLLGIVASVNILRGWSKRGVVSQKPSNTGWRGEVSRIKSKANEWVKQWESAWMEEVRSCKRFPDWGSVWVSERKRLSSSRYFAGLSKEKREQRSEQKRNKEIQSLGLDGYRKKRTEKKIKWNSRNKDKVRKYAVKATKRRKARDPGFKIQCNLRHRFKEVIGKAKQGGTDHFTGMIGCSTSQLAKHLESHFTKRMTWGNYGTYWHVDHVIPCAAFDHTNEQQRRQCWHWTNLRPLEAKANMDKKDSITKPQMELLLCATH